MAREIQGLDVLFGDPMATFRAGDVMKGKVHLVVTQEFKIKGIRLLFNGISRVHWDEDRPYTKGSSSKLSHKNMDVYLDESIMILGKHASGSLSPGRYDWPFSIRMPPYLPASFEGQYGRVQYWAKVVVDRPWKTAIDLTRNFTVIGALDLNSEPETKRETEVVGDMMAGIICCRSGPISGSLALSRRGYIPGENIPFHAKIHNESNKKLTCRVLLVQQATFRADKKVKKRNTPLKGLTLGKVAPGQDVAWEDDVKTIPPVPPSRLGGGCKTIEVKYILKLVVVASGPGRDLEIPVEIILGTVPFRKTESSTPLLTAKAAIRGGSCSPAVKAKKTPVM